MKEVKAFIDRHRVGDVVHALSAAGFRRLSVFDVRALFDAAVEREGSFSIEIGEKVVTEVHLELYCDDAEVERAIDLIRRNGRTGRADSGWIFVLPVEQAVTISEPRRG